MKKLFVIITLLLFYGKIKTQTLVNIIQPNSTINYTNSSGAQASLTINDILGEATDGLGNIFVATNTFTGSCILKIDGSTGNISLYAGLGPHVGNGTFYGIQNPNLYNDGDTRLNVDIIPKYIAIDQCNGDVYFSEPGYNRIRKIDGNTSVITTVAGNNGLNNDPQVYGFSGDGGIATNAKLSAPEGIALDKNGNIYIVDWGNYVIREVNNKGIINTIAGNHGMRYSDGIFNYPSTAIGDPFDYLNGPIAIDNNFNLYISDGYSVKILNTSATSNGIIDVFAGVENHFGYTGDNGLATDAETGQCDALAIDGDGNVYIGEHSFLNGSATVTCYLRKVSNGIITTVYNSSLMTNSYFYGIVFDQCNNPIINFDSKIIDRIKIGNISLKGIAYICPNYNNNYSIDLNVPTCRQSGIIWQVNPFNYATITNSTNGTMVNLSESNTNYSGIITITATVPCFTDKVTLIKTINAGLPQILSNSGGTFTGGGPSMGYTAATGTQNEKWYPCAGYYVQSNLSSSDYTGATSINWSVLSHSSVLPVPNTNPIRFYFFGSNQKATIRLTASNSCGSVTKDYDFVSKNCSSNPGNPCGHFIVKRNNIAAKMVTVSTSTNITAPCYGNLAKGETSFAAERLTGIVIYNKQGTVVKDVCITDTSTQLLNVDLSDLNNGVYSVEVKGLKSYKEVQPIVLSTYNDIASAELIASGEVSTSADRLLVLQQELYNDILELHPDWVDSSTVLQSFVDNNSNSSFGYCYAINDLLQQNNIDDADALLQTWTTANHIDNNYYKYYQYYISFARSNSFSAGDISDLYSIASKCALVEGEVINDSRSLYNAVTTQVVGFEDACGVGGSLPAINTSVSGICVGATASYTEDFPGGVWSIDNSSIATVDVNGTITGIAAGTANIIYTVTSSCGIRTVSAPITVNAIPSVTIGGNNAVCKGNSLQLNSNISGGIWSSSNTGVATIDAASGMISTVSAGQTIVGYSVTGANGCVATATNNITVNALPDATITGATNICLNTTMTYTAGSTGGVWSSSNAGIASINSSTGTVSALGGGQTTITYSVTDANGCFNTKSVTTNVVTKPEVILSASPSPACAGQTITCVANSSDPTANYTWTGSGGTPSPNTGTTVQCVNPTGGTKTFTVTATNGCGVGTKSLSVTVYTLPSAPDISPSGSSNVITIAPCGTQQLKSSVSSGNQWYQDGNAISGATAQTYVAPVGHIYNVTTTNNNGCTSNMSVTKTVQASVFTMSPNPAHTSVSVQGINVAEIDIMSNTGTILISKLVTAGSGSSNTSLSVTGLVTGSYNVIVRYNTGCTQSQVLIVN